MPTSDLMNSLLELHKLIFEESYYNTRSEINVPIFSYLAPGDITFSNIKVPNICADRSQISQNLQDKIRQVFAEQPKAKKFLEGPICKAGIIDCFLNSIRSIYFLSVASNPFFCYEAFLELAKINSEQIISWLENEAQSTKIDIVIYSRPKVRFQSGCFGSWEWHEKNWPDRSMVAMRFKFAQDLMADNRAFQSCYLRRSMSTMPSYPKKIASEEILTEIDILILSFWLATGCVFRVQDIQFTQAPWNFAPDKPCPFGVECTPTSWDSLLENINLLHGISCANPCLTGELTSEHCERITKWMHILETNPKAIYAIKLIYEGIIDIGRSCTERPFRKTGIAYNGIFKILSGMEGLNLECQNLDKSGVTKTFISCWQKIWRKAALHPKSRYLNPTSGVC